MKNRRRCYVVNKRLQRNFTLAFLLLGLIVSICTLEGFWYLAAKEIKAHIYRIHFVPSNPWEVVLPIMIKTTIIFLIVLIITSAVLTRFIFRRLSLKFEAFRTAIEKIGNGDLSTPVLQGGIESLNGKLEETRINLHRMITILQSILKEIKYVASLPVYDEKVLKDLESLSISFKNKLSQFRMK